MQRRGWRQNLRKNTSWVLRNKNLHIWLVQWLWRETLQTFCGLYPHLVRPHSRGRIVGNQVERFEEEDARGELITEIYSKNSRSGRFYHQRVHSCLSAMWSYLSKPAQGHGAQVFLLNRFPKSFPKDKILFLPYAPQMLGSTEFFMRLFNLESSVGPVKRWRWNSGSSLVSLCIVKRSSSCMLILLTSKGDGAWTWERVAQQQAAKVHPRLFLSACFPRRLGQRADTW